VGSTLSLVYVEFGGAVKTGFTFPLSARAWLKASKDDGYSSSACRPRCAHPAAALPPRPAPPTTYANSAPPCDPLPL
jgi:hypothetical protein